MHQHNTGQQPDMLRRCYLSEVGTPTVAPGPMTHLSEVTRVELVHQDPVVVLTTGVTTTT